MLKYLAPLFSLIFVLISCHETISSRDQSTSGQAEIIEHYLKKADNLKDDQQKAMRAGVPFVGMTYEEANIAFTITDWKAKFDGKILKAEFMNSLGKTYTLYFDCGTPNRVTLWSAFTDEEVEELKKFRDIHPCPPIPQLFNR